SSDLSESALKSLAQVPKSSHQDGWPKSKTT
ncbi:MAG: hypothetical protein ACI84C_002778, partial [Flavobacteriales bacterium]